MLNIFPTMFLSLLAHALLRVILGGILIYLGCRHLFKDRVSLQKVLAQRWPRFAPFLVRYFCVVEVLIGGLIFVGAFTQVAAIAAIVLSIKMLVLYRHFAHPSIPPRVFYVLVLGSSLSLFITGAGALAFDLPF